MFLNRIKELEEKVDRLESEVENLKLENRVYSMNYDKYPFWFLNRPNVSVRHAIQTILEQLDLDILHQEESTYIRKKEKLEE